MNGKIWQVINQAEILVLILIWIWIWLSFQRNEVSATQFPFPYFIMERKKRRASSSKKRKILSIGHFSPIRKKKIYERFCIFFLCLLLYVQTCFYKLHTCLSQHPKLTGIKSRFLLLYGGNNAADRECFMSFTCKICIWTL